MLQIVPTPRRTTSRPDVPVQRSARVSLAHRPWREHRFPGPFPVPCQLTADEIDYLYWLTSHQWSGRGRVVELGCLLGGSTYALAAGMRARTQAGADARSVADSRGLVSQPTRRPLLTYDSFITPRGVPEQFTLPVREGESFRAVFERNLAEFADSLVVREGWIPENQTLAQAAALYPEQEPIEILFIDCAKKWGVHPTVLRAFVPHLIPGVSIVVQQDYKAGLAYILLHMHQLRKCFEPVHSPAGGTLAFRYLGGAEAMLDSLWQDGDLSPADADRAWAQITADAGETREPDVIIGTSLSHGRHLRQQGRLGESVQTLEAGWDVMCDALIDEPRAAWRQEMVDSWRMALESEIRLTRGCEAGALRRLVRLARAPLPGDVEAAQDQAERLRAVLWRRVAESLRARSVREIALYGAGRHARELLATGWPHGIVKVACLLDDQQAGVHVCGTPVLAPRDLPASVGAIVPCSQEHEESLIRAARRTVGALGRTDVVVASVYTLSRA